MIVFIQDDLALVLDRAWKGGMEKMIVTGGSLAECQDARDLCEQYEGNDCHLNGSAIFHGRLSSYSLS
jgi:hypothetical protein